VIHIAPSILAADFSRLGQQVAETERAGASRIHVDVMDGHFVPNLSMGACVVQGLRPGTQLPLEVHLMVEDPARFFEGFAKAGADSFIVHHEVLPDPRPVFQAIRNLGKKVGFAVNPDHPIEALEPYLGQIDLALCMTVHPGFGGQPFIPESPDRIRRLRQLIDKLNPACELEVDGGVDLKTAPTAVAAGANVLVIGTGIFRHKDGPAAAVKTLTAMLSSR
jgi:ribulose-phosphate 3-epimerase